MTRVSSSGPKAMAVPATLTPRAFRALGASCQISVSPSPRVMANRLPLGLTAMAPLPAPLATLPGVAGASG